MSDEHGPDEKVLCVPAHDARCAGVEDIDDISECNRLEMTHFFEVYKELEPAKSVEVALGGPRPPRRDVRRDHRFSRESRAGVGARRQLR